MARPLQNNVGSNETLDLKQQQNQINTCLLLGTVSGSRRHEPTCTKYYPYWPLLAQGPIVILVLYYSQFLSFSLTIPIEMPYKILIHCLI